MESVVKLVLPVLVMAAVSCCGAGAESSEAGGRPAALPRDPMAAHRPFMPAVAPKEPARAELRILPGKNMALVRATLEGRECTLLFDTGATHTTFDIGFLRRELPEKKLGDVMLAGTTNVEGAPKIFAVRSLKIGDASFAGFYGMALDMSHLGNGIGAKVDGILGMNVIGRVPALVSFGASKVVFAPGKDDVAGFGEGIARIAGDPFSVAMEAAKGERKFELIVDSASTFTFLGKSTGWPSTGEPAGIGAVDVNGRASLAAEKGRKGPLKLGSEVEISPLIVDAPMNRIGADALLAYDMLVEQAQVKFRRRDAASATPDGRKELP